MISFYFFLFNKFKFMQKSFTDTSLNMFGFFNCSVKSSVGYYDDKIQLKFLVKMSLQVQALRSSLCYKYIAMT